MEPIHKYVICGQDCNKYVPKIINCFITEEECILFLNEQAKTLLGKTEFNIRDYQDNMAGFHLIFSHMELFKQLFVDDILIKDDCLHFGEIIICKIEYDASFNKIYDRLRSYYA